MKVLPYPLVGFGGYLLVGAKDFGSMAKDSVNPVAASADTNNPRLVAQPADREIEVKFQADSRAIKAVLASSLLKDAIVSPARQVSSTYFDTSQHDLKTAGMTLRIRRKSRSIPLLGVKWRGEADDAVFARGEVEVRCPDGMPDLTLFKSEIQHRLTAAVARQPLSEIFETCFKRRIALIRHGHSEIELAIDEGVIIAGSERLLLAEMEAELKKGNLPDLLDFAARLVRECGLSLQFEPKAGRGYRLATAAVSQPYKSTPLKLYSSTTFDDLVAAILANSLSHFAANWAALRETDVPETIHQLRVALRRLRSALGMFRKTLALPEVEELRSEARRIASGLGPARECDAFRINALAGPFSDGLDQHLGAKQILEATEKRRGKCYTEARQLINDPRTTLFVLKVQDLIARRPWRQTLAPEGLTLLNSEAKAFAADVLNKLKRRALKRGKHLSDMPDVERHELRIVLKTLRYAVEFFGSMFDKSKDLRSFLKRVTDLQDDLGAQNDAVTARVFIESLSLAPSAEANFASGYLIGWYRHAALVADTRLVEKWRCFKRQDIFWD